MAKGKYKKNRDQQQEDMGKKKKNIITPQLLMDKSNMDFTQFIPLLPQDIYYPPYKISAESTKAILKILTDFNYLLYLDTKRFWATATYNISFARSLSSCLSQMSIRWMNQYKFTSQHQQLQDSQYRFVKDNDSYQYTQCLQQVILKVIYRIMSFQQQDPRLNQIYNFGETTITKLNLFSFPKLLQLIQIYSSNNPTIVKIVSKNYLRTVNNSYKFFNQLVISNLVKKMEQNNRDVKMLTDREEFGINYSYNRSKPKQLSPGQQELKRKITILCNYLSFFKIIHNTQFLTEQIRDHCFFNFQVHIILQNAFYQLDAAYKVWSYQGMQKRILPLINHILDEIKIYFIEYFRRINSRLVLRNQKPTSIQAYIRSLQRILVDYGKRQSLGKKGNAIRNMKLFQLIAKQFDLVEMLTSLYNDEMQNKTYQFNIEYLIDFKLAVEDILNQGKQQQQYIQNDVQSQHPTQFTTNQKQYQDQIQCGQQRQQNQYNQSNQSSSQQQANLQYKSPQQTDRLQVLISKKDRDDDYFEKLYMKQRQGCKIQYDDQYDDLVDYDKRPLFQDQQSSDSDSQDGLRLKRLVSNQENQKNNQQKHIKFEQKQKQMKMQTKKYAKVSQSQKVGWQISKQAKPQKVGWQIQKQEKPQKAGWQVSKQQRSQKVGWQIKPPHPQNPKPFQRPKYQAKPSSNNLQQLLQTTQSFQPQDEQNQRNNGYKKKYVPNKNDQFRKGGNKNKNRQYGDHSNNNLGGGKKYKPKNY